MPMRPRTLFAKLAAVLIGLLCSLGLLFGAVNLYATKLFMQELNQRFNRDLARQLLVQQDLASGTWLDKEAIARLFSYYMHINPAIEIYLLDSQGEILAFEAPEMKIKRQRIDLAPIQRFLDGDERYPILGDDPRHEDHGKTFSAAAIPMQGPPRQYLYVVLSGEDYDNLQALLRDSYFLQLSIAVVAVSLLFGLLAGLYAFNLLTARLQRLTQRLERFRASGFKEHQPYTEAAHTPAQLIAHGDEIDGLGATFDQMAKTIIEQVAGLEQKDTLRRNLVANVSHDLRTPLASLQGYLETLLLKPELAPEQQRHYLETAFRHGERLTRLVSELFELSKLEAQEATPHCEPIAMAELVQDVAQQFRLQAEQNGIELTIAAGGSLPFANGDMAMLNRVMENLIGNAIAHTPQGGAVTIGVTATADGIEVAVSNSGPAIAAEDMPYLFERFYQAPERRHGNGAGLGLAIVHRILELHGSMPQVQSNAGQPTTFRFILSRWTSR